MRLNNVKRVCLFHPRLKEMTFLPFQGQTTEIVVKYKSTIK